MSSIPPLSSADSPLARSVPYWPLWLACLLGYAAMGMTIQVMPVYAQQQMGRQPSAPAWR